MCKWSHTVNAVNFAGLIFSRLAAQKTYSRVVKFALSRCSLVIFVLHKVNIFRTMIHLQATGQHKNKAGLTHSPVYYPFASTHMVNTQLLHVPNVHTKYCKYFRGCLNSRLLSFARNSRKLMYREYYHVYSIVFSNSETLHRNMQSFNIILNAY